MTELSKRLKTTKADVKAMNEMMAILAPIKCEKRIRMLCSLLIFCAPDGMVKQVSDIVSQIFREDV